jgi:hypothetical protein
VPFEALRAELCDFGAFAPQAATAALTKPTTSSGGMREQIPEMT